MGNSGKMRGMNNQPRPPAGGLKHLISMVYQQYRASLKKARAILDRPSHLRKMAKFLKLSKEACLRLEWIIYHQTTAKHNVSLTCRHFGLKTRKTFYKWFNLFDEANLKTLENKDRAPKRRRIRTISPVQEQRVIQLRKQHLRWGKEKLAIIYQSIFHETISSWKIQKTIERYHLYYHPLKAARLQSKRKRAKTKKRITELKHQPILGFTIHLDTIVIYWNGLKRYIITAIDHFTKVAFARMYTTNSSYSTADFLYRLNYLLDHKIINTHTDNGSEFQKNFGQALEDLHLTHYFSRPRTPKDNPSNERFNRTLKEEFIQMGNFTPNLDVFNHNLTEWLIEYNFIRPHHSLDKLAPIIYAQKYHQLFPMYPSHTIP